MKVGYSRIVLIVYGSIYWIGLVGIAILRWKRDKGWKQNLKDIWKLRSIFAPTIVGIYDTMTDTAVIIDWGELWYRETYENEDSAHIDAAVFFFFGVAFLFVYRFLLCAFIIFVLESKWVAMLGFIDLHSMYLAYIEMKEDCTGESLGLLKTMQLGECIFEAVPQLILQIVFVIRFQSSQNANYYLILVSILASLISITTKYTWFDSENHESFIDGVKSVHNCCASPKPDTKQAMETQRKSTEEKTAAEDDENEAEQSDSAIRKMGRCELNAWYVVRIWHRIFEISTRLTIYSLLWAVVGGLWLPLFGGCAFGAMVCMGRWLWHLDLITSTAAIILLVASPIVNHTFALLTVVIDTVGLVIVTAMVFVSEPKCHKTEICANFEVRNWGMNRYVQIFVMVAYISFSGYIISYLAMFYRGVLNNPGTISSEGMWGCCADCCGASSTHDHDHDNSHQPAIPQYLL